MNATTSRRPRERIGADAARVWARELVLGNPHAKAVLLALANYMTEAGSAYPGLTTIARDTDLNEETVIKRIRWLESIGAIVVYKCWIDENGRRNSDGRGRITSSEICFLMDADPAAIEEAAKASTPSRPLSGAAKRSAESSSPPHGELNSDEDSVSSRLAPCRPSTPAGYQPEGGATVLTEEQESPPQPPSGGTDEKNDLSEFQKAWVEPFTRQSFVERAWAGLTAAERHLAVRAARGYVTWRKGQKKPPNVQNAHTFLREKGGWAKFATLAPDAATRSEGAPRERVSLPDFTPEGRAFAVCQRIAGVYGNYTLFRDQIPTGADALAALWRIDERGRIDTSDWVAVKSGTSHCAAWAARVKEWLKHFPDERRFWLNAAGDVVRTREEAFLPQGALAPASLKGLLVPPTETGFPPAKGSGPAPIPKARAGPSEEELEGAEF